MNLVLNSCEVESDGLVLLLLSDVLLYSALVKEQIPVNGLGEGHELSENLSRFLVTVKFTVGVVVNKRGSEGDDVLITVVEGLSL